MLKDSQKHICALSLHLNILQPRKPLLFSNLKPMLEHVGDLCKTLWLRDAGFFYSAAGVACRKLSVKDFSHIIFLYKLHRVCHRDDSHFLLGIRDEQKGV